MEPFHIALYGCGTVGMGVARMLLGRGALQERLGERIRLKYIVDLRLDEVRDELQPPEGVVLTDDLEAPLRDTEVQAVVELLGGTTIALEVVEKALRAGKDVVTANKALLAQFGDGLYRLARERGRSIAFEAGVAGGIPVVAALRSGLVGDRVESLYGIVNGTCNYVLTQMLERNIPYEEALVEAQREGYAESDPRLDVEGLDSAHKLAVLSRLAFGVNIELDDIPCDGITGIELSDLRYADALGYTVKLLAVGIRREAGLEVRVHPALLRHSHPLSSISGVYNAICVHGDHVGEWVLTGRGAGRRPTASAVVADIVRVALGTYQVQFAQLAQFGAVPAADLAPIGEVRTRYYLRLDCMDRPGVLASVAGILGEEQISLASVRQQETAAREGEFVPVVLMTHKAREVDVQRALERINRLEVIYGARTRMLRVEDV
ncbi:MAG: homoserine dehydrogenase [Planctomycetes bacterium]|nr:homoserine dehydrogenase [Planctomycetota bacterium]